MSTTRVFVGHLARRTQDRDILELFGRYGRVENVLMKGGYAFVEMSDPRAAADAIADLDGREFDGSQIAVELSKGERGGEAKLRDRTNHRVVLEGVPEQCTWRELKDFGRQAGRVLFADVKIQDGRRVGVIEFAHEEGMLYAIRRLDGSSICGAPVRIRREGDNNFESASSRRSRSRGRRERSRSRDKRRRTPSPTADRRREEWRRIPRGRSVDRDSSRRRAGFDGHRDGDRHSQAARRDSAGRWEQDYRAGSGRWRM